ncbi:hypothetical protein DAI22_04g284972 [Oryza sativa Japonica Group]|nr:hypothetical protein DAI22_04g284972 [Oryza sativa Japonica Group]
MGWSMSGLDADYCSTSDPSTSLSTSRRRRRFAGDQAEALRAAPLPAPRRRFLLVGPPSVAAIRSSIPCHHQEAARPSRWIRGRALLSSELTEGCSTLRVEAEGKSSCCCLTQHGCC